MRKQYDFSRGKRGAVVQTPPGKTRITIRVDDDVLEWFREQVHAAGGGNYQSLINAALREHIASTREPLEDTLRRVIREEMGVYTVDKSSGSSARSKSSAKPGRAKASTKRAATSSARTGPGRREKPAGRSRKRS